MTVESAMAVGTTAFLPKSKKKEQTKLIKSG